MTQERKTINIPYDEYLELHKASEELINIKGCATKVTINEWKDFYYDQYKTIICYGHDDVLKEIKPLMEDLNSDFDKVKKSVKN